jgi:RNA polymerase sigma factor for flagellar operon FliA
MPSETTFAASAREQMILSQMPQVELLAKYMHRRCPQEVELDDLISAGTVGLIKAVDR